jgi:DNA polymerase
MPGICPPLERWRCSMVQAYMHSLPGSLDKLCSVLRVPIDQAKDKAGRELVRLFCMPGRRT